MVMRPDSGGGPIRADASLAELGNVDVVVLPPFSDGLDDSLAAHPDLIVWLKSLAADDVLLISRKHPQRTPPRKRWWQPLNRHCAQTPGRRLGRRAHPRPCAPPPGAAVAIPR